MSVASLVSYIENRCQELGIKPRGASLKARNGADFVRDMKRHGNAPKTDKLISMARVLGVPPATLFQHLQADEDDFFENALPYRPEHLESVEVVGVVQAGLFTEALEWDAARRYSIKMPVNDGYPSALKRYALEVRGESMNRVFPDGSLVSVIDFDELGRPPETGDYVVVMRRDKHGAGFEATIKAIQIRDDGSACLWPQSTDPDFQQPFILPAPNLDCPECAGAPDLHIKAVVVGMIKTRLKATF